MASLSISTPFKPSIFPSPSTSKPLKTLTFFSRPPPPPQIKAIPSSYSPPKPTTNAELGPGVGLGFSPFYSATREMTMGGAESDVMGLLLTERIVFLGNEINDFVADAIICQILFLDAQDHTKDIRLFINSPGGSLSATMAIFDVVQLVQADVSTVGMGIAASTSSIILGGGTKGKRFAMPNTRIMIHQPLGGASGQAIDVEVQAKEVLNNKNNIIRIVANFTGRSLEQVEKDIDRDRYMSPMEAVEYGIIDGVIDRDVIIPLMPVPDKVKSKLNYEEISKDPKKFLTPEIPDDEIY